MSFNPAFGRGTGRGRGRGRGWIRGRGRGRGGMSVGSHWAEEGTKKNAETHPEKQESKSEPKISERYNEEDADVSIISSDNVLFKVHSFPLARASPVFKSMLGIAQSTTQRDPITMTDPHVELSIVIKAALDILYDHEVCSFRDDTLYHHVVEFARKWDIPIIIKTIIKELHVHASTSRTDTTAGRMFRLAIDVGDHDVIALMVERGHDVGWPSTEGTHKPRTSDGLLPIRNLTLEEPILNFEARRYLKLSPVFPLGGWPYHKLAALPLPLIWAMLRAEQATKLAYKSTEPRAMPLELKRLLNSMYPNQQSKTGPGGR